MPEASFALCEGRQRAVPCLRMGFMSSMLLRDVGAEGRSAERHGRGVRARDRRQRELRDEVRGVEVIATRRGSEPRRRWDGQAYRRDMDRTSVAGEGRATPSGVHRPEAVRAEVRVTEVPR